MSNRKHSRSEYFEGLREKQQNTVWPNLFVNSRALDAFLLRGSVKPSLVQRMAAWLMGIGFLILSVTFALLAEEQRSPVIGATSALLFLLGIKIFSNGFRKRKPIPHAEN